MGKGMFDGMIESLIAIGVVIGLIIAGTLWGLAVLLSHVSFTWIP